MKQLLFPLTALACLLSLAIAGPAFAGHGGGNRPVRQGILLVAFGTTVPSANSALENIGTLAAKAFPGVEIRWAYTSRIVREVLAERGEHVDSPAEALATMGEDGFTHVAVQSLHTIPGEEFHNLLITVKRFENMPKGIEQIALGAPLLAAPADMDAVADALMASLPADRKAEDAVVLMGHGTHHPGNVYYPGMQYYFSRRDPNVLVGTVEGVPSLDDVSAALRERGVKRVFLMPFMAVAGDHATNDMAGNEEDSWKSVLSAQGFRCIPVLKGTGELDAVAAVWIEHLKAAFARLH